jgi:hypothetical protein
VKDLDADHLAPVVEVEHDSGCDFFGLDGF